MLVAALVVTWFISEGDIIVGTMLHGSLGCGLLVQGGDESGESLLGLPPEHEDRVTQEAVEFVPACVAAIAAYWVHTPPT